jgi:hypothetical protein
MNGPNRGRRHHPHAIRAQLPGHDCRGVGIFVRQQAREGFDHGDVRAQQRERLRQLASDRAAANHQQRSRLLAQLEDVFAGQISRIRQAGDRRNQRAAAGGNHRSPKQQLPAIDDHATRAGKGGLAKKDVHADRCEAVCRIVVREVGATGADRVHDEAEVDARRGRDAGSGGAARVVDGARGPQ